MKAKQGVCCRTTGSVPLRGTIRICHLFACGLLTTSSASCKVSSLSRCQLGNTSKVLSSLKTATSLESLLLGFCAVIPGVFQQKYKSCLALFLRESTNAVMGLDLTQVHLALLGSVAVMMRNVDAGWPLCLHVLSLGIWL